MWPFQQNVPLQGADPFQTKNLWPGATYAITESATVWTRIFAPVMSVLVAPSSTLQIFYRPIGAATFATSRNGVAILFVTGDWEIRMPVTSAGPHTVTHSDLRLYGTPETAAIAASDVSPVNVQQIGGTVQTGLDFTGKFAPITMLAPAVNADVDASSEEVVAARTGRRYLYVENTSSAGQILWLAFGANAAVVGSGIRLSPGQFYELIAPGGVTEQAVNAIASAVNGSASVQEGT